MRTLGIPLAALAAAALIVGCDDGGVAPTSSPTEPSLSVEEGTVHATLIDGELPIDLETIHTSVAPAAGADVSVVGPAIRFGIWYPYMSNDGVPPLSSLAADGIQATFLTGDIDASVLASYDVLFFGRAGMVGNFPSGAGVIQDIDALINWVWNGGVIIGESNALIYDSDDWRGTDWSSRLSVVAGISGDADGWDTGVQDPAVSVTDPTHPVAQGVSASFTLTGIHAHEWSAVIDLGKNPTAVEVARVSGTFYSNPVVAAQYGKGCSVYFPTAVGFGGMDWSANPDYEMLFINAVKYCGVIEVEIDIKPGGDPNCVNKDGGGRIAVAVLSESGIDLNDIDVSTVRIDDDTDPNTPGVQPVRWSLNKDVSGDEVNDLVFHFKTQDLNVAGLLTDGNTLTLTGSLFGTPGTPFEGSDVVYLAGEPSCFDLFGVNSNDDGLSKIDPATGIATFIGPLDPDPDVFVTPIAMAVRPSDGKIFVWNNDDQVPGTPPTPIPTGVLLTVDPATGLATRVDATTPNQGPIQALAFAPDGRLFGLDRDLFEIDPATGVKTQIGSGLGLRVGGADFDASGTLYGVELAALAPERLVTIDINTGIAAVVGTLNPDVFPVIGSIVFDATGTLIGSTAGPENPILFDIDPATAAVSNVRAISGGFPPQGMGFAPEF
jgi:hypothetical protein